jgi:hypothetical protein
LLYRILSHRASQLLDPAPLRIAQALRAARAAVFPGNAPGPPRVAPEGEEGRLEIRRRAAEVVVDAVPGWAWGLYLGYRRRGTETPSQEEKVEVERNGKYREYWVAEVEGWLDLLEDPYVNKHLVVRIVELVIVRVLPELGETGVDTLLSERVGGL